MHLHQSCGIEQVDVPQETKEMLCKVLHKAPHLLVFVSPDGSIATECAKAWLCDWLGIKKAEHPDLLGLACSGKMGLHSIESIRNLIEQLSLAPFSLSRRGVYIDAAERMLPSAANSLLKLLEEPPPNTVIILATNATHHILPTILSRAQVLRIPGNPQVVEIPLSLRELLVLDTPSYAHIVQTAERVEEELEESKNILLKQLREEHKIEDLSPQNRQQMIDEIEGEVTLWAQRCSSQVFEAIYLASRGKTSPLRLQQALDAIQRATDVKNTLVWFLSDSSHVSTF